MYQYTKYSVQVVQLVKTAKEAFHWIPGPGKLMFEDFMRHVRKQKACKKDYFFGSLFRPEIVVSN
ncbi:unnamed protein product [Brugia timori]|uniref:Uncharacterized protein n=1 Tax=Brugia timori TaxID=42155 RepID=A0A3P7T8V9_9BILA|nr:unnamed protein product [Brugia timori]